MPCNVSGFLLSQRNIVCRIDYWVLVGWLLQTLNHSLHPRVVFHTLVKRKDVSEQAASPTVRSPAGTMLPWGPRMISLASAFDLGRKASCPPCLLMNTQHKQRSDRTPVTYHAWNDADRVKTTRFGSKVIYSQFLEWAIGEGNKCDLTIIACLLILIPTNAAWQLWTVILEVNGFFKGNQATTGTFESMAQLLWNACSELVSCRWYSTNNELGGADIHRGQYCTSHLP